MYIQQLSLVYSYPKTFLLFFYLILTALTWYRTIFLDLCLGFVLFVASGFSQQQNWGSLINFPKLVNCFLIVPYSMPDTQSNTTMSLATARNAYNPFWSYVFILLLSLTLHTECPTKCHYISDIFSNAVHVIRNLFRKI